MTTFQQTQQRWARLERELIHRTPTLSREAVEVVLGRRGLDKRLRSGELKRLLPGIYCLTEQANDHATRCHGLSNWGGGKIIIGGRSALHLTNPAISAPAKVHAMVGAHEHVRAPSWVQLRHLGLPTWRGNSQGIDHLTVEDATVDAWHRETSASRERLCYEVLWRRIATAAQIQRAARRFSRVSARRDLTRILEDFINGAASPTEAIARRRVFEGRAFASLEWQVELSVAGRIRRADAFHRDTRVVIEFDGAEFHAGVEAWNRDRQRDAEFAAAGYLTLRFSYTDLITRSEWCREQVIAAIAHRLSRT